MGQSVGGGSEDDTLGKTCTATSDHQKVGFFDLDDGEQTAHRVAELFHRLVVDIPQIKVGLDVVEDLLLALHERSGKRLRRRWRTAYAPPALRRPHDRDKQQLGVPVTCDRRAIFSGPVTPFRSVDSNNNGGQLPIHGYDVR